MSPISRVELLGCWRTDWKIRVKIHRKWMVKNLFGADILHFIFVDEEGCKIQATAKSLFSIPRFETELQEGQWRIVKNFVVSNGQSSKRLTKTISRISLVDNTIIRESEQRNTGHSMNFVCFKDLMPDAWTDLPYTVDVLGVVAHVGELEIVSDSSPGESVDRRICQVPFRLRDAEGYEVEFIAKGKIAIDFYEQWKDVYEGYGFPVCVLSDWRVHDDALRDEGGVSRFWFELDIDEVHVLKDALMTQSEDDSVVSISDDEEDEDDGNGD